MKVCSVCLLEKPFADFSRNKRSKDGRGNRCGPCNAAYMAGWRARNPGAFSRWHKENEAHRSEYFSKWYAANKDSRAAYNARWLQDNRASVNARVSKRMAQKVRATPSWADSQKIEAFYARAAELTRLTGVRHEVDHIYPLQSDVVCGLHCEANLQILTKSENISKLNRMPEEWRGTKETA